MWAAPHLQACLPKSALAAPALLESSLSKARCQVPGASSPAVLIKEVVHSHSSSEALGSRSVVPAGSFASYLFEYCFLITKIQIIRILYFLLFVLA